MNVRSSIRWTSPAVVVALVVAMVAGVAVLPGADARAQTTLEDIRDRLSEVRAEREAIEGRIEEVTADYEHLRARISELEDERAVLQDERDELRTELDELDSLMRFRVRETFKHGAALDPIAVFLGSEDPAAAFSKAQTIQRLVSGDKASSEDLEAVRTRVAAADELLAEQSSELDAAVEQQSALSEQLQTEFAALEASEADLSDDEREELARIERERREREQREREQREREQRAREEREQASTQAAAPSGGSAPAAAAAAATSTGGMACPLDQPRSFIDSWGYARSGGRSHRGTDIMGPRGIPVRAITNGVWAIQSPGPSAGLWAILRGDDGNHYWYLHLDSHTVGSGARVTAGQQVATNGATGNATPGAEHIHFELHPGGGSAVNPYAVLRSAC